MKIEQVREAVINDYYAKRDAKISDVAGEYSLESINKQISDLTKQVSETKAEATADVNTSFFRKLFHGNRIKIELEKKNDAKKLLITLQKNLRELNKCKSEIARIIEEYDEKIKDIENPDALLNKMSRSSFKQYFADEDFMLELVNIDAEYLKYDKTNCDKIGLFILERYKQQYGQPDTLKAMHYRDDDVEKLLKAYAGLEKELTHPAKVEEGQYKVPHRYLVESIKGISKTDKPSNIEYLYDEYKKVDGSVTEKHGKKLEELYDADTPLYMHKIGYRHEHSTDELNKAILDVCKNGLMLSNVGKEVGNIAYVTIDNKAKEYNDFLRFLEYWADNGIIVLQANNNDAIIGTDDNSHKFSAQNPGVARPQFVSGYVVNGEYFSNPIPMEERTNYKYCVQNGQQTYTDLQSDYNF